MINELNIAIAKLTDWEPVIVSRDYDGNPLPGQFTIPDYTNDIAAAIELLADAHGWQMRTVPETLVAYEHGKYQVVVYVQYGSSISVQHDSLATAICLAFYQWKTGTAVEIEPEAKQL